MESRISHRCFVLLAGFLLCLHTFVPHVHRMQHAGDVRIERGELLVPGQGPWLGLLRDVIGTDMGQGHLEHLSVDRPQLEVPAAPAVTAAPRLLPGWPSAVPMARGMLRVSAYSWPEWPPDDFYPRTLPLRGPPTLA